MTVHVKDEPEFHISIKKTPWLLEYRLWDSRRIRKYESGEAARPARVGCCLRQCLSVSVAHSDSSHAPFFSFSLSTIQRPVVHASLGFLRTDRQEIITIMAICITFGTHGKLLLGTLFIHLYTDIRHNI